MPLKNSKYRLLKKSTKWPEKWNGRSSPTPNCDCRRANLVQQVAEVESLKQRMKKFHDYDDIKRELEIMKVTFDCTYL